VSSSPSQLIAGTLWVTTAKSCCRITALGFRWAVHLLCSLAFSVSWSCEKWTLILRHLWGVPVYQDCCWPVPWRKRLGWSCIIFWAWVGRDK
jgi:hypothetical protein